MWSDLAITPQISDYMHVHVYTSNESWYIIQLSPQAKTNCIPNLPPTYTSHHSLVTSTQRLLSVHAKDYEIIMRTSYDVIVISSMC